MVASLIATACGGDVKACMHILDRIHGRVQDGKPEGVCLEDMARAERRRLENELLDRRVQLADRVLAAGGGDLASLLRAAAAYDQAGGPPEPSRSWTRPEPMIRPSLRQSLSRAASARLNSWGQPRIAWWQERSRGHLVPTQLWTNKK